MPENPVAAKVKLCYPISSKTFSPRRLTAGIENRPDGIFPIRRYLIIKVEVSTGIPCEQLKTRREYRMEMKAFLQYLKTKVATSALTERLDRAVNKARAHKEWKVEYMTLLEKLWEEREEGHKEGLAEGRAEERIALLQSMLQNGKKPEEIHAFCGYPMEEIRKAEKELFAEI